MKNHWIKISERKKSEYCTAEFSRNGIFILKPRKVAIPEYKRSLNYLGSTTGLLEIVFKDGMSSNDKELSFFIQESKKDMSNWISRIRLYQKLSELECYELNDINLNYVGLGRSISDLSFSFKFNDLKYWYIV